MTTSTKPRILILHGLAGTKENFSPLIKMLQADFEVIAHDFPGHGGRAFSNEDFSIQLFAKDVVAMLKEKNISSIHVFGFGLGGYTALYLARYFPDTVNKIFTLATKFEWNPDSSKKESKKFNPEKIEELAKPYASILKQIHQPNDWKIVMKKAMDMVVALGNQPPMTKNDLRQITHSVALSVGDADFMVAADETLNMSVTIPNASFLLLNNTPHIPEQIDMERIANELKAFML